ncbi:hypothetical protein [Nocardia harenae]|uniref:hypothetical protein n=1 Tax=Nocardia harenae TaxID=358707 RepID=UPI00082C65B2|nr:hypothetical protein [Nocardia harenae]
MREWIIKLSAIDGDAAAALRVIEHFDTLADQGATALAMLRAAAALADCPVGIDDPDRGLRIGADADGRALTADYPVGRSRRVERFEGISVWLDRSEPPWPLDELILERFARSLHAVKTARRTRSVSGVLRTLCDPGTERPDRERALRELGLRPGSMVTIVVTHRADADALPAGLMIEEHQLHLFASPAPAAAIPASIAAGTLTCPAGDIGQRWPHARTALRVAADPATAGPAHVAYEDLGGIAVVAESVDAAAAARADDVRLLEELRAHRPWVVEVMNAVLGHASIREAARRANLHHSTLHQRVTWLQHQLGYTLLSTEGYLRGATAVLLWRIARAAELSRSAAADPIATAIRR